VESVMSGSSNPGCTTTWTLNLLSSSPRALAHAGLWGSLHTLAPLLIFFAADALYPRLKGRAALLVYLAHARSQRKVGSKAARIIDAVSPISSS
jgi:hypothetical protein